MRNTGFHKDPLTVTLFILVLIFGGLMVFQAFYILTTPEPETVLHFPVQSVLTDDPDSVPPKEVSLSETSVTIEGTKCNIINEPIKVTGTAYWRPVAPGGKSILYSEGVAERQPGCYTTTYVNDILPEVKRITCDLIRKGFENITWEVSGTETPLNPDYLPESWRTEPFILEDTSGACT